MTTPIGLAPVLVGLCVLFAAYVAVVLKVRPVPRNEWWTLGTFFAMGGMLLTSLLFHGAGYSAAHLPTPPWVLVPQGPALRVLVYVGWFAVFALVAPPPPEPSRLDHVEDALWEHRAGCRFKGFWLFRRMTVVRLADGGLWVHSPNALTAALEGELRELGPVRYVVAPSLYHHAHLEDYRAAFPDAALCAPADLAAKRTDLSIDVTLDEGALPWDAEIATQPVDGVPELNEHVFFHRASATLIVADLLFCFGPQDPWLTRMLGRVDGTYGRIAVSRDARRRHIEDPGAFEASAEAICAWPVERVLMAHAQEVEVMDADQLRRALLA